MVPVFRVTPSLLEETVVSILEKKSGKNRNA